MKTRLTAIPLLLLMLIASIGMPVNVHSCVMAGMVDEVAPSCGMCAASHDDADDGDEGNGCCDNRLEIDRSAPATAAKGMIALEAPAAVAVLSHPMTFCFDLPRFGQIVTHPANGPPPGLHDRPVRILFSSFLL